MEKKGVIKNIAVIFSSEFVLERRGKDIYIIPDAHLATSAIGKHVVLGLQLQASGNVGGAYGNSVHRPLSQTAAHFVIDGLV